MIENLLSTLRKNSWLAGATFCMAIIYSCEEDVVESRPQLSGDEIVFSVATDSTWKAMDTASSRTMTKENSHFFTALGEDSLYISMVEEENHTPVFAEEADSVDSRGASLLSTTFNKFKLTAFLDVNNTYSEYMKNQLVEKDGTGWKYSPIKYWPADKSQSIHFFGYAQSKETPAISPTFKVELGDSETYTGTFSYTLSEHTDANEDAEAQPDLVFAITPNKDNTSGTVNLNFQHALSAVVFKIGNVPDNVTIKDISFTKVLSVGNCAMKLNGSNIDFTWTPTGTLDATYTQTFNEDIDSENEISSISTETCFMMIPQTLTADALLAISMKVNGRSYILEKKLTEVMTTPQWVANKKYTYIISLPDEVKVHVDDKVDEATEKIKSDLVIKNTGLSPIYVRAAIIGNWVTEKIVGTTTTYDVVADWLSTDGTFDWGGEEPNSATTPVRNWLKGPDGFYYYTKEIARGGAVPATDKLFNTYTLTANSPVPDAVLDLTIAVQALRWDDIITPIGTEGGNNVYIWPSDIVTKLQEIKTPNP